MLTRRAVRIVGATALAAAAALAFLVLAASVLVKSNLVTLLSVESGSMEPAVSAGDLLVSRQVDADEVKAGDITTVEHDGSLVTHRVVHTGDPDASGQVALTLKGDANAVVDARTYATATALSPVLVVPNGAAAALAVTSSPVPQIALVTVLCLAAAVAANLKSRATDVDEAPGSDSDQLAATKGREVTADHA